MAVSSNRSPSPLSTRPNSNPRSSENHQTQPGRRSFSGSSPFARPFLVTNPRSFNPITPANSPADSGRRQSVGKGRGEVGSPWGCEEKENEKDQSLKSAKLRSPAKGSKNFMSPTISAASKFTPSPRKKVLVERNDPVRTSMTLSDGRATFFSANSSDVTEDFVIKSEVHMDQKYPVTLAADCHTDQKHTVTVAADEGPLVCKPVKKVTFKKVTFDSHDSSESLVEKVSVATFDSVNVESNSKNKPYCSSVESLSDTVAMGSDSGADIELCSNNKPYCSMVEPLPGAISVTSDFANVESCSEEKPPCPSTLSPIIAPLDADPSIPPYDPKTNYLSPRPQFLHYKPNPRIELLLNKENELSSGEIKCLEGSFMCEMSENFSDSEGTEESQTGDSLKEPDEASSVEMVPEAEEPEVSESLPVSTQMTDDEVSVGTVETIRPRKPRLLTRWKSVSMLLVFLIACVSVSVTDSPLIDSSLLKSMNLKLYEPSEVATFAKVNFDGFTGKLKQWSANSMAYLLKLIPIDGEANKLGPLTFINLTAIPDDPLQFFEVDSGSKVLLENVAPDEGEEEDVEDEIGTEEEVDDEIETPKEVYSEADIDDGNNLYADDMEISEVQAAPALLAEINQPEISKNVHNQEQSDFASKSESEIGKQYEDHLVSAHQALDIQFEVDTCEIEKKVADIENLINDNEVESPARVESNVVDIEQESSSKTDHFVKSFPGKSDNVPGHFLALSLIPLALVAVLILFYQKQRNATPPVVMDSLIHKEMKSVLGPEQIQQEKPSYSQNWATEFDVVGESCPSEMSSFEKNSYYSRRESTTRGSEAQSHERRPRKTSSKRESLASSSTDYSMGSASYGSFTTYERIPIKHASGEEEEMMTPVRRSSRLRNQVTSP